MQLLNNISASKTREDNWMEHQPPFTVNRKNEHIQICLSENVNFSGITNGFENWKFKHCAMPELDFSEINISTSWLDKAMKSPFLVSSMTGGSEQTFEINKQLAIAAEERGWAIGLGSIRVALEQPELLYTFQLRKQAPSIPIIANIGMVQLNYQLQPEQLFHIIEQIEADALVLHLNAMQEIFQPEGDKNFKGLWNKLEQLVRHAPIPVGIKEVGFGIDGEHAKRFTDIGVAFIDVAGAGGTSWIEVEKHRARSSIERKAADAFKDWGNSTAQCIVDAREVAGSSHKLIASGGMSNGVDAAKAIALGADYIGFGRILLSDAVYNDQQSLQARMEQLEFELKAAMFGIGAQSLLQLKQTKRLIKK